MEEGWLGMGMERGDGERWMGKGRGMVGDGRWEMEEEWKERGMEGAGISRSLKSF